MKKLLAVISMFAIQSLFAELHYDKQTYRYHSSPLSPEVNQAEYHQLVWHCLDLVKQHRIMVERYQAARSGFAAAGAKPDIVEFLSRLATPTSIRLLQDLEKINFWQQK